MRRRVILYTALLGDYDELKDHAHPKEWSFCFTDRRGLRSRSWTLIPCRLTFESLDQRIRAARYYKAQSHRILPDHDFSVWTDASMQLSGGVEHLVHYLGSLQMAAFKYPDIYGPRCCSFDEAIACIERGKDAAPVIRRQMQRYRNDGFPPHFGLAETTVLVRANTPAIAEFNDLWWDEIRRGSRRDQLSFDYACWRRRVRYAWLPGYRLNTPFARFVPHKEQVYCGHEYAAAAAEPA